MSATKAYCVRSLDQCQMSLKTFSGHITKNRDGHKINSDNIRAALTDKF